MYPPQGNVPILEEVIADVLWGGNLIFIPTNAGWIEGSAGGGVESHFAFAGIVQTSATASSTGLSYANVKGFNPGGSHFDYFNWDKKLYLAFNYARQNSDAEVVARLQLNETGGAAVLGAKGIGFRADNLALTGESYGTELGEVNLSVTLTNNVEVQIVIIHYPASKIEWYVDGVLKGTQSTTAKIPSGTSGGEEYLVHSIVNGVTGGTNAGGLLMHPKIWQER